MLCPYYMLLSNHSVSQYLAVTRCQIFRLKCTKFNFGWGSNPDPAGGAYSALPDPYLVANGLAAPPQELYPPLSAFGPR